MKFESIFGKPSILWFFISVFLIAFLLYDFYMVLFHGEIMMLRSAEYVRYDDGFAGSVVFFMALLVKIPVFCGAVLYVFYCIANFPAFRNDKGKTEQVKNGFKHRKKNRKRRI